MMHPRDQWFFLYVYTPGVAGPTLEGPKPKEGEKDARKIVVKWIEPPTWGKVSDVEHVRHPDSYHPDVRTQKAHHREMLARGVAVAACGLEHDPRMRFIETEGVPKNPCARCAKVTEEAKAEHAAALEQKRTIQNEKRI